MGFRHCPALPLVQEGVAHCLLSNTPRIRCVPVPVNKGCPAEGSASLVVYRHVTTIEQNAALLRSQDAPAANASSNKPEPALPCVCVPLNPHSLMHSDDKA